MSPWPDFDWRFRVRKFFTVLLNDGLDVALAKTSKKIWKKAQLWLSGQGPALQNYQIWMSRHSPRPADLEKLADVAEVLPYQPTLSIILIVHNSPEGDLQEAVESVLSQVYPHWQLCLVADAATEPPVRALLKDWAVADTRIQPLISREQGASIVNQALKQMTGDFFMQLEPTDRLSPDALFEVALLLNRHPNADLIYSDEDQIGPDRQLCNPAFKPDWNPDYLLSRLYTGHLSAYRRTLVEAIGGFRDDYQHPTYDLILRLTEQTEQIFHIPKVLYHSREVAEQKESAIAQAALSAALARRGEPGRVIPHPEIPGLYTVRYEIANYAKVSIIIPTRNYGDTLNTCLESIFEKTTYPNYEVLVIDNGSTESSTLEVFEQWRDREPDRFRCLPLDIPFNYSKINNYGVQQTTGKYLLLLNNDTEVVTPDWLDAMVEQAQRPSIGAVGPLLLYPDDTIQHAGLVLGLGGTAGHSHKHMPADTPGYLCRVKAVSNVSAVTGACLMCRRDVFESIGGFDETLGIAYNDVELCIKILAAGYRNIYLPHVVLYHYESKSRGYEDTPEKQRRLAGEARYLVSKWKDRIEHDPCYSPHLTRAAEDYGIRLEPQPAAARLAFVNPEAALDRDYRVAAYITVYRDPEAAMACIAGIQQQTYNIDAAYILDNSPETAFVPEHPPFKAFVLEHAPENLGIGHGLVKALHWATEKGYDFLWTFDQDSVSEPNCLETLLKYYEKLSRTEKIGIIAPLAVDTRSDVEMVGAVFQADAFVSAHYDRSREYHPCDAPITSGSLISLEAAKVSALPRADLFIDGIDTDYGMQLKASGFSNFVVLKATLKHNFSEPLEIKKWGRSKYIMTYSALRHYYICRNHTYLETRYAKGFRKVTCAIKRLQYLGKSLTKIGLFDPANRPAKLGACLLGTWHGFTGKLGKNWPPGRA